MKYKEQLTPDEKDKLKYYTGSKCFINTVFKPLGILVIIYTLFFIIGYYYNNIPFELGNLIFGIAFLCVFLGIAFFISYYVDYRKANKDLLNETKIVEYGFLTAKLSEKVKSESYYWIKIDHDEQIDIGKDFFNKIEIGDYISVTYSESLRIIFDRQIKNNP